MNWREALYAMSIDAAHRCENSKISKGGPSDPYSVGRAEGAAYAFNVMAEEMKYLAQCNPPHTALRKLRRLLGKIE